MEIRFFFEYDKQIVQLPVNPEELVIQSPGNNKTTEIVKLGEVNQLRERKLKALSVESFLPQREDFPFVLTKGKFELPEYYVEFFERVRADKRPMRLIVTGLDVNMPVAIERFETSYEAGDDDLHFKLELKEWRHFAAREVVITTTPTGTTTETKTTPPREPAGFAIGDAVIANGKYWYSSYGAAPYGLFTNFTGVISHIVADATRKYRYHIKTTTGASRGWVAADQLKHK